MGQRPTEEEIFKMISEVDEDHTGHIGERGGLMGSVHAV